MKAGSTGTDPSLKPQAPSRKLQAASDKRQATSGKPTPGGGGEKAFYKKSP
tara:strand:- start:168 stop:320 length:153 start_codon:yes stop_codon:yes gene_type:complete